MTILDQGYLCNPCMKEIQMDNIVPVLVYLGYIISVHRKCIYSKRKGREMAHQHIEDRCIHWCHCRTLISISQYQFQTRYSSQHNFPDVAQIEQSYKVQIMTILQYYEDPGSFFRGHDTFSADRYNHEEASFEIYCSYASGVNLLQQSEVTDSVSHKNANWQNMVIS